jgi:hypothetical protein
MSSCVNWAFFLTSVPFLNASETSVLKGHECQKTPNLHTNELNTTCFCSTSPLKAPNRLKSLKLAWRFVLTSWDIYQNPFTQEKILKFWQCRTKNRFSLEHAPGFERGGQPNLHPKGNSLFDEFLCKLGFFGTSRSV